MLDPAASPAALLAALREFDVGPVVAGELLRSGRVPYLMMLQALATTVPDRPALIEVKRDQSVDQITFGQLLGFVEQNRVWFTDVGVDQGMHVTVHYENGIDHALATLALWACGAVVIPIDPRLNSTLRSEAIDRSGAAISVGPFAGCINVIRRPGGHSLARQALLSFTRSSTGLWTGGTTRKARLVVQNGLFWGYLPGNLPGFAARHGLDYFDRQLVSLPLHHGFGFGFGYLFGLPLAHTLVFSSGSLGRRFPAFVQSHSISYAALVPAQMSRIDLKESDVGHVSSLRKVLHAASRCPPPLKRHWIECLGADRILEAYGATDALIDCVISGAEWLRKPGSVGRPASNVVILDRHDVPMPAGLVGRIATPPPSLGPLPADQGVRALKYVDTGDLGHLDSDGYLFLAGRSDTAVDIGGITVYLEQIEDALLSIEGVDDGRVTKVADSATGREWLRAEVQLQPPTTCSFVADALAMILPAECCPKELRSVDELRRARTGKRKFETDDSIGSLPPSMPTPAHASSTNEGSDQVESF